MEFTVKRLNEDETAIIEMRWTDPSTKGWLVTFISVKAMPDEITGGLLSESNPLRLRAIEKAKLFLCSFSELLSSVEEGMPRRDGQLGRQRS
jgi:hypothetical protein